jgi:hypothetical protein
LAWWCAGLALLPDLDLLFPLLHRRATHSITAALLVLIIAAGVTRWVTGRINWRTAVVCALAYSSHLLLDWLGADPNPPHGIRLLWPFSTEWFIADRTFFPPTERRAPISTATILINLRAAVFELVTLGLVAGAIWAVRRRRQDDQPDITRTRRSPDPTSGRDVRQRPSS